MSGSNLNAAVEAKLKIRETMLPPRRTITRGFIMRRMCKRNLVIAIMAMCAPAVLAAAQNSSRPPETVRNVVREYRQKNEAQIVRDYAQLLSLPNVASDTAN